MSGTVNGHKSLINLNRLERYVYARPRSVFRIPLIGGAGICPETTLYSPRFVESNFDALRVAAIEDLTRYSCGWSIHSISFLNAVADSSRRTGAHQAARDFPSEERRQEDPKSTAGKTDAQGSDAAFTMKIEEIMTLISAEVPERRV